MAEALMQGWIKQKVFTPQEIYVTNRSDKERLQFLHETYGVQCLFDQAIYQQADLIILAMKPKDAVAAMRDLKPKITTHSAVLSILAVLLLRRLLNF